MRPEDGPGGTLYYTDASCELQAIELPAQTPAEAPGWDECRFVLSHSGQRASGAGSGWDPRSDPLIGRLFQSENGMIQVATNLGPEGEPFRGTAPAWRPDGTLTYFADGAVREWPSGEVAISRRQLVRAVHAAMPFEDALQVSPREAAWLDDRRLAAILSTRVGGTPSLDLLAVYDGDRLASFSAWEREALSDLRVSPQGNYVAARSGAGGLVILDSSGLEMETPRLTGYRAIAWSPDERWAAIAADDGVFFFRPGEAGPPSLELALDAHDLAWRGEAGTPVIADAEEAREWLDGTGATGRLFVSLGPSTGCTLRALRLPELVWDEEPQGRPAHAASPSMRTTSS